MLGQMFDVQLCNMMFNMIKKGPETSCLYVPEMLRSMWIYLRKSSDGADVAWVCEFKTLLSVCGSHR